MTGTARGTADEAAEREAASRSYSRRRRPGREALPGQSVERGAVELRGSDNHVYNALSGSALRTEMDEIADSPDDFAVAFEAAFARLQVCVEEAYASRSDWPSRVVTAIRTILDFAAADPAAANTLTNEALTAGRDGAIRHHRLLSYAAQGLALGREYSSDAAALPELTEHALAGGLAGIVAERLSNGEAAKLPSLAPEVIQFALTPYLGGEEAKRIAGID